MAVLTARTVAHLTAEATPRYVSDDLVSGLALRIGAASTGGTRTWSLRYRIGRRQRRLTLGAVPQVTLADARQRSKEALKAVARGEDPAQEKAARRVADTVTDFAAVYIAKHAKVKKRSWKVDEMRLRIDVIPAWGHRLMRDITRRDVRDLLDSIAERPAPIVANRVRSLLHKVFNVAVEREIVDVNPVSGVGKPGAECQRDRVLTEDEIRKFWSACDSLPEEMGAAFKVRLLAAQRGGEVFAMRWLDLNLDSGWWTIPASGSKNKQSHRVPLSPAVLSILNSLRAAADDRLASQKKPTPSPFVFRNARGKRQQAEAVATFGIRDFRGHDLRRTAASLMTGSGTSRLVVSKVLNHAESGVTKIYDRHSYDAEKRLALDRWAQTLDAIVENKVGANVVAFARA